MPESDVDKMLSVFSTKGALVKVLEPCVHAADGSIAREGKFDFMEREFRAYKRTGVRDPNSGAAVVGNEDEFVNVAREARDERLVGLASGQVARAAGSLKEGTGLLYDLHGRPLVPGNAQQAPISRTKRSPRDW